MGVVAERIGADDRQHALYEIGQDMLSVESLQTWQDIFGRSEVGEDHLLSNMYSYAGHLDGFDSWSGHVTGFSYPKDSPTCSHKSCSEDMPALQSSRSEPMACKNKLCRQMSRQSSLFFGDMLWRDSSVEQPKLRHLFLSLVCISLAFFLISWKKGNSHLIEHRGSSSLLASNVFDHEDSLRQSKNRNTCGRRSSLKTKGVEIAAFTSRVIMGAEWGGFGKHYCGPVNGRDFALQPSDVLDAVCAQHDYCIEKSRYLVGSQMRTLYPIGHVDDDSFQRCGIPLQSHRNPNFAARIAECDQELLDSLAHGFHCSADPDMPKGRWCDSDRLAGKAVCSDHAGSWSYPLCHAAAAFAERYHRWKIESAARPPAAPLPPRPAAAAAPRAGLMSKVKGLLRSSVPAAAPPPVLAEAGATEGTCRAPYASVTNATSAH